MLVTSADRNLSAKEIVSLRKSSISLVILKDPNFQESIPAEFYGIESIFLLDLHSNDALLAHTINRAISASRDKDRLAHLHRHLGSVKVLRDDPALDLVAGILHRLAEANTVEDLRQAIAVLRPAIDFDYSLLIRTNARNNTQPHDALEESLKSASQNFQRKIFLGSDEILQQVRNHALDTAVSALVVAVLDPDTAEVMDGTYIILVRKGLDAFTSRDLWLLEFAYPALATSVERILILDRMAVQQLTWQATFDAISEPVSIINANREVVAANQAFHGIANSTSSRELRCHSLLFKRQTACGKCPVGNQAKSEKISLEGFGPFQVSSFPVTLGRSKLHIQFYRSLREESLLTSALIQSEKMIALGSLLSAIAHEINNPLTSITALAQILLEDIPSDKREDSDLFQILDAGMRCRRIIRDLLGFGGSTIDEKIPLDEAIVRTLGFAKTVTKNIRIQTQLNSQNIMRADSLVAMQQIIFNLVTNAAHALKGKGNIEIRTEDLRESEQTLLTISDNGPGFPQERLLNLFEPFHSEKQEGQGTGLGLAIVKTLVTRIGGKIEVSSKLHQGTTFRIFINYSIE